MKMKFTISRYPHPHPPDL